MFRHYTYYIIGSLCLLLAACDHIDEADRLYDPLTSDTPESIQRVVLLEDFTGQRCPNCPKATDIIDLMHEVFGDKVVAVGIHGGPLAYAGSAKVVGLKTEAGDEYFSHWNLEYQPVGLVNRHGAINYLEWTAAVKDELSKPATLRLNGTATLADGIISILVNAEGNAQGKLQVWLLEDGITALQFMPDGTSNKEYVHNHVFRTAVNGTWGEDFSVAEGKAEQRAMSQALAPEWNPEKLSVVAFVYNDQGVQQATKFKVE